MDDEASREEEFVEVPLRFTRKALSDLDELTEAYGFLERSEMIRNSLRLAQWVLDRYQEGGRLCLETDEGVRAVIIPFLPERFRRRSDDEDLPPPPMGG